MAGSGLMDWSVKVPLNALANGPVRRVLSPDEAERAQTAERLAIVALERLEAEVTVAPWLDGAEVKGRWRGRVVQTCGVSLDPFPTDLSGEFRIKCVPAGSPNAPSEDPEIVVDMEAEDPPDVLPAPEVDIAAYVVEHLALELDPFPRAPGVEFEAPEPETPASPFAALQKLKPPH
jgi:uncharacterized metal-binding protein YceD (DUF177 family)